MREKDEERTKIIDELHLLTKKRVPFDTLKIFVLRNLPQCNPLEAGYSKIGIHGFDI